MHIARNARRRYLVAVGAGLLLALVAALSAPPLAAQNLPVSASNIQRAVRVTGNGFVANEPISLWMTAADRSVTPLETINADGLGSFALSVAVASDGTWLVTAHGLTSKREVVTRHIVGTEAAGVSTAVSTGAPGVLNAAGVSGTAAPAAVVGEPVTLTGSGMNGNEQVSVWMTAPDGKVTALAGLKAERGNFDTKVTFPYGGYWQVTAKGRDSGREVIKGYSVTEIAAATAIASGLGPTATPAFAPPPVSTAALPTPTVPVSSVNSAVGIGSGQQFLTPPAGALTPPAIPPQP